MRNQVHGVTAIVVVAVLAILGQLVEAQQTRHQPPKYYVFNLGDPGGGTSAAAASINNLGWIAGDALQSGNTTEHAELWIGTPVDLGTLGGANSAIAWPNKNTKGELAGIAETSEANPMGEAWSCAQANFPTITYNVCQGFVWQDGVMTALPPLSGGIDSYAAGINNQGQVAGWAENGVLDPTCNNTPPVNQFLQFEAVVWGSGGQVTQLAPLSPDPDSAATAINDKGQVVGISGLCSNAVGGTSAEHAVLWESTNAPAMSLGNFDGGVAWNTPTALNNRTQIVGFANQAGSQNGAFNPIAFLWDKRHGMQALSPIGDDTNSWAWGINERGDVVGESFGGADDPYGRAFLYEDGMMTDLNSLVQSKSSLQLVLANDINEAGEIAGFAVDTSTGATVAFLAVPVQGEHEGGARNSVRSAASGQVARPLSGFARFATDSRGK